MTTRTRISNEFGDLPLVEDSEFGDRRRRKGRRRRHKKRGGFGLYGLFGDVRRRLKRPYKKSVVRSGRKLAGHHKIGKVSPGGRGKFRYVTRGGSVYEAHVTKGHGRRKSTKGRRRGRKK